ncbi:unnamed protein product [Eretmochelys imbricata]
MSQTQAPKIPDLDSEYLQSSDLEFCKELDHVLNQDWDFDLPSHPRLEVFGSGGYFIPVKKMGCGAPHRQQKGYGSLGEAARKPANQERVYWESQSGEGLLEQPIYKGLLRRARGSLFLEGKGAGQGKARQGKAIVGAGESGVTKVLVAPRQAGQVSQA